MGIIIVSGPIARKTIPSLLGKPLTATLGVIE